MLSSVGTRDLGPFRKLLRANLFLSFGLSALSAIPIFACSSWIMRAYGRDFLAGKPVLILLVVATVISATAAVVGQAIAGLDRMWWGFGLNSVWALVLLGCASLLAPRYGALGLAAAVLAAYLVHAIMVAFYARVHLRDSRDPAPQLSLESAHDVAA
jgi:O-antigen/teichoic acid export membrane protein